MSCVDRSTQRSERPDAASYFLELNEIHLALKRTGMLVHWTPETEVRSPSDLASRGYAKYYDAVVMIRIAGRDCRFALEYERTLKAMHDYEAIRQGLKWSRR